MPPPGYKEITPRDLQVLKWIAIGEERDAVAERLGISRPAVNRHMAKVMKLTATVNSTAAVAHVMALGLLQPGDVTSRNAYERMERAATLAPKAFRLMPPVGHRAGLLEAAAYVRSQKPKDLEVGTVDAHVADVMESMARELTGRARLPIPSPRRDPDAPRVPEQPKRDS
jgi:DNA-binding CsgD family transcriptional regulator